MCAILGEITMNKLLLAVCLCVAVCGVNAHDNGHHHDHPHEEQDVACWRGDQCSACSDTGSQNGVTVCCPTCFKAGMTMIGGTNCTCFMIPPNNAATYHVPGAFVISSLLAATLLF